jgi:phosphoglycerate dehydrogenase-like enzyme
MHIAHNLNSDAHALIGAHFPGTAVTAMPPDGPWNIPDDATAFVFSLPYGLAPKEAQRPHGWPKAIRLVQLPRVGIDDQPAWLFEAPMVCIARGTNSVAIAEYVLAAMLTHEKRYADLWMHPGGAWPTLAEKVRNAQGSLHGKTLGLAGYGDIGKEIARLARAFNMRIVASRRSPALSEDGVEFLPLQDTVAQADHLVCAAPLTESTRNMFNAAIWAHAKPGQHFINVGRGGLVDHDALLAALRSGRLAAATLDVTEPEPLPADHPLLTMPNVRISPHCSAVTEGIVARTMEKVLANLKTLAAGGTPADAVDPRRGY